MLSRMTWWQIPSGEAWFRDWAGYARGGRATPGGGKESGEDFATGICIWSAAITFTCSFYLIRMSKKIWTLDNGPRSGGWSRS